MYGILKSVTNTGSDDELSGVFVAPMTVVSNKPAFASDTLSLRHLVSSHNTQRWEIESNLAPSNDGAEAAINMIENNTSNLIYVRVPQIYRKSPVVVGYSISLSADAPAGTSLLNLTGTASLPAYMLPRGEFITFAGDPKVYMILDPGTPSGYNSINVKITPSLAASRSIYDVVTYGNLVTMECYYDPNTILGIKYTDGILTDPGSVKLLENI